MKAIRDDEPIGARDLFRYSLLIARYAFASHLREIADKLEPEEESPLDGVQSVEVSEAGQAMRVVPKPKPEPEAKSQGPLQGSIAARTRGIE